MGTGQQAQNYAFGYSPAAVGMMESRSVEQHAKFFVQHLSPGMDVLDIGCGPGSITVGLANLVAPGEVTGIDIESSQVELAQSRAKSLDLDNCQFRTASVFDPPLHRSKRGCSFRPYDSHAVCEYTTRID
jgi:2-polyprenyl-3-methyl-5-hydroxy-6-metoxy-1,4-benzoquinol methylase